MKRARRVTAVFFLLTAVVLSEIGMAGTEVHEMRVTVTIPPAIELRIGDEDWSEVALLHELPDGFEAVLHVILCTNAPPTQLYMELGNHDFLSIYYSVVPGRVAEGAGALMLATQPRCWLGTAASPGEHVFTLRLKLKCKPHHGIQQTLLLGLLAQDHLGITASREVRISLPAQP